MMDCSRIRTFSRVSPLPVCSIPTPAGLKQTTRPVTRLLAPATHSRTARSPLAAQRDSKDPTSAPDLTDAAEPSTSGRTRSIPYTLVAGLASVGALETAYLTAVKLFQAPLACPTDGCSTVLNSAYAELFGVPLPLFGFFAYASVAAVALASRQAQQKSAAAARPDGRWSASEDEAGGGSSSSSSSSSGSSEELLSAFQPTQQVILLDNVLVGGVALLASCSGVLIYLLATEFSGQTCLWCYLSAALSLSSLAAVLTGLEPPRLARAAAPGFGALAASVVVLSFGFGGLGGSSAEVLELAYTAPVVHTSSTPRTVALAKRLRDAGAKMYGAFWCSHCFDQKEDFGVQAMADFPYVECYPEGWKKGVKINEACDAAEVKAFPSWVINGKLIEGARTVDELEKLLAPPAAAAAGAAVAPTN